MPGADVTEDPERAEHRVLSSPGSAGPSGSSSWERTSAYTTRCPWSLDPLRQLPAPRILVTGSAGHLGEALVRVLRAAGEDVRGADLLPSPFTDLVGSLADRDVARRAVAGVDAVLHAATLHKPHVGSHTRHDFVAANVTATVNLLEEAVAAGVGAFVFTRTTSAFGRALAPPPGAPAAWITEDVMPVPRNVYGVTKTAAEDLCELVHRDHGLPVVILRTCALLPRGATTATTCAPRSTTPTSRSTSCSTGASTSRTSSAPTAARSTAPRRSASAATS